ncbi:MAG TPA: hypothetical protein VN640_07080 [Sphingomicrobium sp.]|nr:hypothetical protein [Sphingomicrobium sp.]
MPTINGTNKGESLNGTASADVIDARRGNDMLDGHGGDDVLTGGGGADKFIFHFDGSTDVITDFSRAAGDTVILDSGAGVYDGIIGGFSYLYDGAQFSNHLGTATFTVHATDYDGDGVTDTLITEGGHEGGLVLLGIAPSSLTGDVIYGG